MLTLYIMYLISTCISMKQTRFHVNSAYVTVFVMRLWCAPGFSFNRKSWGPFGTVVKLQGSSDLIWGTKGPLKKGIDASGL
jgi:hypothetical protein